ncbi:MAG: (Fe-S)-binding protein, partial [Anaerolineales bacterium]
YGLYACIQCGKCTGGCPMVVKTSLIPRNLIYRIIVAGNGFDIEGREELWDCTTCSTCASRCPKLVNPMEAVIGLRSAFVEKGKIHSNVKVALESTFRHGNPLTMLREERSAWAENLELKPMQPGVDYLYYAGCTPSYDPRVQKVSKSIVNLMNKAEVNFGYLGNDENCCGSEVRRLGEAGLFEMMVEDNQEVFKEFGVTKMFTTSPHCMNAYLKDYPQNGLQVSHYTQVLANILKGIDGGIQKSSDLFSGKVEATVTYHDPCYLGKHNGIFDPPRDVLASIPGVNLVEMDRSREKSLCCEGGGGRMWLEGTNPNIRLAQIRVKEALETGAEILATACPFCLLTLEEAVKHLNAEDKIRVMDVAEIAEQAL